MCVFVGTQTGPFVKLQLGQETSFYVDNDVPTHCFSPCAHMASDNSVKYVNTLLCDWILFIHAFE